MAGRKEFELLFKLQAALGPNFNSSFNQAMSTTKELQGSMQQVNSLSGKIDGFKRQTEAVESNRKKLELLTEEHDRLQAEMSQTEEPSESLKKQFEKNAQQIEKTTTKIEEQEKKLDSLGKELRDAGVDTENLSSETKRLANSYDQLKGKQEEIARLSSAIGENKEKISELRKELALTVTAATGLAAAFYKIFISTAAGFEEQMSVVKAISGATAEEMQQLNAFAKQMGATTAFTAVEAGQAMEYMAMAGWDAQEIIGGLAGVMNLAAASGEDLAMVSDIVTDAMTAFGMGAEEAERFADVMAATATSANTNVGIMGETFKNVAPLAGALGYSIEDMSVAIGLMANSGVKGSKSGTALKNIISNLADLTDSVAAAMQELNISLTNADGSAKSFEEVVGDLRSGFDGLTEAEKAAYASTIAGRQGMAGLLALVNSSEEDFAALTASINDCSGAAQEMADIRLDNFNGATTLLSSAWEGLATSIGELFLPNLTAAVRKITDAISVMNDWVNEHPKLTKGIITVVGALVGLKAGTAAVKLGVLLLKNAFLGLKLKGVISGLGGVKTMLGGLQSKMLPIIAVIGAVALAIKLISGNLEEVRGWIQNTFGDGALAVFDKVWAVIQNVGNVIKGVFSDGNISGARDFFENTFGAGGVAIFDALIGVVEQLKAILPKLMDQFANIAQTLLPVIFKLIGQIVPLIGEIIATVLPVLLDLIASLLPLVGQIVEAILPVIIQLIETLIPIVMQVIEAILPVIISLLEALMPIVTMLIENVLPIVIDLIGMVIAIISPLIDTILPILTALLEALMPVIQLAAGLFSDVLGSAIQAVSGIISGLTTVLGGIIDFITGVFTGNWTQAWEGIKSIFGGIWEAMKALVKAPINFIIDCINTLIRGLNKIKIPDWVPGLGGKGINISEIPKLAKGSDNTPDTFIAGEKGAELITNAPGRKVFTAAETGRIFDNMNAARDAGAAQIIALAPILQAALAAKDAIQAGGGMASLQMAYAGVAAPTVAAPDVQLGGGQQTTSVVIHSQPTFQIGSDTDPAELEELLRRRDEELLEQMEERLDKKAEDERRSKYD